MLFEQHTIHTPQLVTQVQGAKMRANPPTHSRSDLKAFWISVCSMSYWVLHF